MARTRAQARGSAACTTAASTPISTLSDEMLGAIFMLLPQRDRMQAVPLVCRSWCQVNAEAVHWPMVDVAAKGSGLLRQSGYASDVDCWLGQRSRGMRELHLQLDGFNTPMVQSVLLSVAPAATQLQGLQLCTTDHSGSSTFDVQALACICQLTSLTRLELAYIGTPVEPSDLEDLFASLPGLEHVKLKSCPAESQFYSDYDDGPGWDQHAPKRTRPDDFPQSLLRCTRLTSLQLNMCEPNDGLPRAFLDLMFAAGGLPDGITSLQRLQHLALIDWVTAPLTRSLSLMTHLTSLFIAHNTTDSLDDIDRKKLVALPDSLRNLNVTRAPMRLLTGLTALEHLNLHGEPVFCDEAADEHDDGDGGEANLGLSPTDAAQGDLGCLSMLQRLTSLQLDCASDFELHAFASCSALRRLHLRVWRPSRVLPLPDQPYQQLMRLQLQGGPPTYKATDVLALIRQLPQLEVLEMVQENSFDILALEAAALSQLPKLRRVDLLGTLLWKPDASTPEDLRREPWAYLPFRVAKHLMCLLRAYPAIEWVLGPKRRARRPEDDARRILLGLQPDPEFAITYW